jgi:hypothetical protein
VAEQWLQHPSQAVGLDPSLWRCVVRDGAKQLLASESDRGAWI